MCKLIYDIFLSYTMNDWLNRRDENIVEMDCDQLRMVCIFNLSHL